MSLSQSQYPPPESKSTYTQTTATVACQTPEVIHYFCDMKNDCLLTAIQGGKPGKCPIWILGQVGQYLPEFRDLVKKHGLHKIWHTQSLITQATLMPIERFKLDGAIICSHISLIPEAMGMKIEVTPEPKFPDPLTLDKIGSLDFRGATSRLTYVTDAITEIRHELKGEAVVIGFAAGPWTLMSLMIEGGYSSNYNKAKQWLYLHEKETKRLIDMITFATAEFCLAQARAGAQVIQVYDMNAGHIERDLYEKYFVHPLRIIRNRVKGALKKEDSTEVPMVMYAKEALHSFNKLRRIGYDVLSLEPNVQPQFMKDVFPSRTIAVQGNLNPYALFAPKDDLITYVHNMLKIFKGTSFIVNLGNFIHSDTPLEGVYAFIEAVRSFDEKILSCSTSSELNPMLSTTSLSHYFRRYSASFASVADKPRTTQRSASAPLSTNKPPLNACPIFNPVSDFPRLADSLKTATSIRDSPSSHLATGPSYDRATSPKGGSVSSKSGSASPKSGSASPKGGASSSNAGSVSPGSTSPPDISSPSDYPSSLSTYSLNPEHRPGRSLSESTSITRPTAGNLYALNSKYQPSPSSSASSMQAHIQLRSGPSVSSTRPSLSSLPPLPPSRPRFLEYMNMATSVSATSKLLSHASSSRTGSVYKNRAAAASSSKSRISPAGPSVSRPGLPSDPTVLAPASTRLVSTRSGLTTSSRTRSDITPTIAYTPAVVLTRPRSTAASVHSLASSASKSRSGISAIRSSVTSTLSALASSRSGFASTLSGIATLFGSTPSGVSARSGISAIPSNPASTISSVPSSRSAAVSSRTGIGPTRLGATSVSRSRSGVLSTRFLLEPPPSGLSPTHSKHSPIMAALKPPHSSLASDSSDLTPARSATAPVQTAAPSTQVRHTVSFKSQSDLDPCHSGMATIHTAVPPSPIDHTPTSRAVPSQYRHGSDRSPYMTRPVTCFQSGKTFRKGM